MTDHTAHTAAQAGQTPQLIFAEVVADYDIVIVGSGPAGLAAASRAAELGNRHVLLEAEDHASDTIFKYQKGKHVMAEPSVLPLRCGMSFEEGKRETIIGAWNAELEQQQVHIEYKKKVIGITKASPSAPFEVACEDGTKFTSRTVIVGIGLQGNIRKLGVPGESLPNVQYTLADPAEFKDETIIVVGAGDAGIENALGLAKQNNVVLMNRDEEFGYCKEANKNLILGAEKNGQIIIQLHAYAVGVEETTGDFPMVYVFDGKNGQERIPCHRVIARLGAIPPRKLVESFGIVFPNQNPTALPVLSESYESNVPGLFVVGALGGYPLIKQAMNQGYEVVQTINQLPVVQVDEPILREHLAGWRKEKSISEILEEMILNSELFKNITKLQMREVLMESHLKVMQEGEVIFKTYDYTNTFFTILNGNVDVEFFDDRGALVVVKLAKGKYFGEMGLLSGRRRTATIKAGKNCVILETARRAMLKLIASNDEVRKQIDTVFARHAIGRFLGNSLNESQIDELMATGVDVKRFNAKTVLFKEGDPSDGLYLIRRGSVTVSKMIGNQDCILSYVAAGNFVGEMAVLENLPRSATVTAAVMTEVLILKNDAIDHLLANNQGLKKKLSAKAMERSEINTIQEIAADSNESAIANFYLSQGLGEGTDVLVIDESLCVQCNNCQTACAETHQGVSRLKRESGATFAKVHVPIACRHCEHPSCMKECPPDALSRAPGGEVYISDACIGCGNCERNCPYGVISMAVQKPPKKGGGLSWLLFGLGEDPGHRAPDYDPNARKKAVKCDMCKDIKGGPSCVRSCPTGAAIRISPEKLMKSSFGSS